VFIKRKNLKLKENFKINDFFEFLKLNNIDDARSIIILYFFKFLFYIKFLTFFDTELLS
jgi:hypothetical protein